MENITKQPLHNAVQSFDLFSMKIIADRHSLDFESIQRTAVLISDYARQGCPLTPLQAAVMTGNYRICKRLISEGASFVSLSQSLSHPLNIALGSGNYQIAKLLITSGANVCLPQNGFYPMYFAIKPESPEYIVEAIIKAGFSPSGMIECMFHSTAMHRAVTCNNLPVVKLLIKYKVNCDQKDSHQGYTPIHMAVKQSFPDLVRLLVVNGVNLETECKEGFSPLFHAIVNNDLECVRTLVQFGAKIDHLSSVKLTYPLNFAVSLCEEEITNFLLIQGADVHAVSPASGNSALHSVCMSQKGKLSEKYNSSLENIVCTLINNGINIHLPNMYGYAPLQLAIKEENFEVVKILVIEGAKVSSVLDQGTNFHFISRSGHKEVIIMFLEHGADPTALDNNGLSPYHIAVCNHNISIISIYWKFHCPFDLPLPNILKTPIHKIQEKLENQKFLFKGIQTNDLSLIYKALEKGGEIKGCSVNMPYPIHFCSENGYASVVKLMLDRGVAPSTLNENDETPLHLAVKYGHYYICLDLLRYGATYNSKIKATHKTPLKLAVQNEYQNIAVLLKDIDDLFKNRDEKYLMNRFLSILKNKTNNNYVILAMANCCNRKGETLMQKAFKKGHIKLATFIMKIRLHEFK